MYGMLLLQHCRRIPRKTNHHSRALATPENFWFSHLVRADDTETKTSTKRPLLWLALDKVACAANGGSLPFLRVLHGLSPATKIWKDRNPTVRKESGDSRFFAPLQWRSFSDCGALAPCGAPLVRASAGGEQL